MLATGIGAVCTSLYDALLANQFEKTLGARYGYEPTRVCMCMRVRQGARGGGGGGGGGGGCTALEDLFTKGGWVESDLFSGLSFSSAGVQVHCAALLPT